MSSNKNVNREDYDDRHGGPFDRGSCDSYYMRGRRPHMFEGATYQTPKITARLMTPPEIEAYNAGYDWNEQQGDFKDYG
jgi:hypothetical protein